MKLLTAILFICFATLPLGAQTPATTAFRIISQCDSAAIVTAPLLQQDYVNDTRYLTEGENSLKLPVDKAFAAIAVITPDSFDVITVADASSDPSLWRETTHHSRGTHILLSEAAAESVYGRNSIVVFPTLLLFDADGRPAGRMDGWHGSEALKNFVILPDKPTPAPQ